MTANKVSHAKSILVELSYRFINLKTNWIYTNSEWLKRLSFYVANIGTQVFPVFYGQRWLFATKIFLAVCYGILLVAQLFSASASQPRVCRRVNIARKVFVTSFPLWKKKKNLRWMKVAPWLEFFSQKARFKLVLVRYWTSNVCAWHKPKIKTVISRRLQSQAGIAECI